mmetsp:Transcript_51707/g.102848  ORF Transcript_51707/g.102848 Transcript_51707/m.102848 type:complete len:287 (+) Transcript_51707:58-918(+)
MDRAPEEPDTDNRVTDPSLVQQVAEIVGKDGDYLPFSEEHELREVLALLEWTFPANHVIPHGQADYIDGSCLVYSEEHLLDVVDFRGAHSTVPSSDGRKASSATFEWSAGRGKSAAVLHSGDVMSSDGGTHVIRVRLSELPASATECFFAISAYNCRNLALFRSLSMRLFDAERPAGMLLQFSLADACTASAVIVCSLARRTQAWSVNALSRTCHATVRDYSPVEAVVAPLQDNHCRWRRRRPYVLLATYWYTNRVLCRDRIPTDNLLLRLLRLPTILFQYVVQFV